MSFSEAGFNIWNCPWDVTLFTEDNKQTEMRLLQSYWYCWFIQTSSNPAIIMCVQVTNFYENHIIAIKSEIWIISYCLWLGHETMICTICLALCTITAVSAKVVSLETITIYFAYNLCRPATVSVIPLITESVKGILCDFNAIFVARAVIRLIMCKVFVI